MSGGSHTDIDRDLDVSVDDSGRTVVGSLRSSWYLWVGLAMTAVLTAIPLRYDNLGSSGLGQLLFGSLTLLLVGAAVYSFLRNWKAIDRIQA